jgi:hypothetical protein
MRLVIYDLGDRRHRVIVDGQPWRVLLQHLVTHGVVSQASANQLLCYLGGVGSSISSAESKVVAEFVRERFLRAMPADYRVILSVPRIDFDHSPDDTQPVPMMWGETGTRAAFPRRWLEAFTQVCSGSCGVGVLAEVVDEHLRTPASASGSSKHS